MHLKIIQSTQITENTVPNEVVDKLYNLAHGGLLDVSSDVQGSISVQYAVKDRLEWLQGPVGTTGQGYFPNLSITAADFAIQFDDEEVVRVLTQNNVIPQSGILTELQASYIVANYFSNNALIRTFNELKFFKKGSYNFQNCINLESVDISNCSAMPNFYNCQSLKYFSGENSNEGELEIPDGVTINTQDTFYKCYGLQTVIIPTTITSIANRAFSNCTNLNKVVIKDLDAFLNINFGSGTSNPLFYNGDLYLNDLKITTISFANKFTIKNSALQGCGSLTSITSLDDVTTIGQYAFQYCSNLIIPSLSLPNLSTLQQGAFGGTKVETISNLGTISTIPEACFTNCSQLTTVTLPQTCTTIGVDAFKECTSLTSISIPNTVTKIGTSAFQSCTSLTNVSLPSSLNEVGDYGFSSSSLTSLIFPEGFEKLGTRAFQNGLDNCVVDFPTTLNYMGDNCLIRASFSRIIFRGSINNITFGKDIFYSSGSCPVYVRDDEVTAWTNAITNNSTALRHLDASRLQPLSNLPVV